MTSERYGLNLIEVGGTAYLLTRGGGSVVHLTREASPAGTGRGALHDESLQDPGNEPSEWQNIYRQLAANYDLAQLAELRWAAKTLCGRDWSEMARGDGPPIDYPEPQSHAPTCRRCLSSLDKLFPAPQLDRRLPVVAEVLTDLVLEHGYAEIRGVPGDQQEALRRRVRTDVRRRSGHGCETLVRGALVVFACQAIHDLHGEASQQRAIEAMDRVFRGDTTPSEEPAWRIWWETWAAGSPE